MNNKCVLSAVDALNEWTKELDCCQVALYFIHCHRHWVNCCLTLRSLIYSSAWLIFFADFTGLITESQWVQCVRCPVVCKQCFVWLPTLEDGATKNNITDW